MRLVATPLLILSCLSWAGCAGFEQRLPPGPWPIPDPWDPAEALRERLPREDSGEVVLDDRDGLSPDEAALLAIGQNPDLRVARAQRGIGQAQLLAAGVLPNPRIVASLGLPVSGSDGIALGYGVGISWDFMALFSRDAKVSAAEENLASIDLEIAWKEWQVAQAARLHAIRSIFLARRLRVAKELEEARQQLLQALERARSFDAVTDLQVTNAEHSYAAARLGRLDLERELVVERAALNQAIGVDPAKEIELDLSFTPDDRPVGRRTMLEDLPQRRLDLLALQHAHRFHDEAARAAVIERFSPVEIGFEAARDVDNVGSAGPTLGFDIPIFDLNRGTVNRERAQQIKIEAEYDARLLEARTDVVRAWNELATVRQQVPAARQSSDAAAELAKSARTAVGSGAVDLLMATDLVDRSHAGQMKTLRVEQLLAELQVALSLASGRYVAKTAK